MTRSPTRKRPKTLLDQQKKVIVDYFENYLKDKASSDLNTITQNEISLKVDKFQKYLDKETSNELLKVGKQGLMDVPTMGELLVGHSVDVSK